MKGSGLMEGGQGYFLGRIARCFNGIAGRVLNIGVDFTLGLTCPLPARLLAG